MVDRARDGVDRRVRARLRAPPRAGEPCDGRDDGAHAPPGVRGEDWPAPSAKAWLHRAEHLLEGEPEAVAHGYLEIAHRELDFDRGNIEGALAHLDRAKEIASRLDDADLPVWVAISRAEVLGTSGQLDEAFGLMEGAAAVAVGGELGPFTTGAVFCAVMSVCRETADYRRGSEWADVSKRWCERQDISRLPGHLPRPSGGVHAAHRCVGRRRLGGGDGI